MLTKYFFTVLDYCQSFIGHRKNDNPQIVETIVFGKMYIMLVQ